MSNANRYVPDLLKMLRPISDAAPAGTDVTYELIPTKPGESDYLYDLLTRYREGDRGDVYNDKPKLPNWSAAYNLICESLATRSKDLQLAAWLVEALMELRGFNGMRDGLNVLVELSEQYWETAFPSIEGGDLENRLLPFQWLFGDDSGGRIPQRLLVLPLGPQANSLTAAAWNASRLEPKKKEDEDGDAFEARKAALVTGGEEGAKRIPSEHLLALHETLNASRDLVDRLGKFLREKCGQLAPGYLPLRNAFQNMADLVRRFLKERGAWVETPDTADASEGAVDESANGVATAGAGLAAAPRPAVGGGPIATREDALRCLEEVAAFFRRTEPHSPIPYLVQRAISWSRMPLEKLLIELIEDQGARLRINTLLGIQPESESG